MEKEDIRWKQRFDNYRKALKLLKDLAAKPEISLAEQAGLIQYFEMAFELAWKVMKDWLDDAGVSFDPVPRETIKEALKANIITNGHVWLAALKERNHTVHTYNEEQGLQAERNIRESYLEAFINFENDFIRRY